MISVEGLKVEFSAKPLFQDVSFVVNDKDRIALVGKNGAGKSTMLKILCGIQKPDAGVVAVPNDTTIGYLPQVMHLTDDTTLREETRKAFADVLKQKERVAKMERELAERTDYESESYMELVEKFSHEHDRFMLLGADNYEAELERTLLGLGFNKTDFERPTSEFSGGWRMRIELAKILLQRPDVLLLDEPTNHLDIESIQWLEQFLVQSAKALVLVSHDRAFINNVTNRTLEISCGRTVDYKVKYDEYLVLRAERREQQLRAYENQQKEIADLKDFVARNKARVATRNMAMSRQKKLDKMDIIELQSEKPKPSFDFKPARTPGRFIFQAKDLQIGYDRPLTKPLNLTFERNQKVAIIGANGIGKTTLLKSLLGIIPPIAGEVERGDYLELGYFEQEVEGGNRQTPLEAVWNAFPALNQAEVRAALARCGLTTKHIESQIQVLSGGEQAKVRFCLLMNRENNVLVLDEPTNHLDVDAKDELKRALKEYKGSILMVCHEPDFYEGWMDQIWDFNKLT